MADESKRASINATLPIIFRAIDSNHDNDISPEEFQNYFVSLGVSDRAFADEVFRAMDANHDGNLSSEEFCSFGSDFFLSTDEASPSKFFFGPLNAWKAAFVTGSTYRWCLIATGQKQNSNIRVRNWLKEIFFGNKLFHNVSLIQRKHYQITKFYNQFKKIIL